MSNTKSKPMSQLERAREKLAEAEKAHASAVAEVEALEQERDALLDRVAEGDALAVSRLEELGDDESEHGVLARARTRREVIEREVLPVVRQSVAAAELAELSIGLGGGVASAHERLVREREEAEAKIAEGTAALRSSITEWNNLLRPLIAQGHSAGLVVGEVDPLLRVRVGLDATTLGTRRPGALIVDGEEFRPVDGDKAVQRAVRLADERVGRMIAAKAEEQALEEFRRIERATSR